MSAESQPKKKRVNTSEISAQAYPLPNVLDPLSSVHGCPDDLKDILNGMNLKVLDISWEFSTVSEDEIVSVISPDTEEGRIKIIKMKAFLRNTKTLIDYRLKKELEHEYRLMHGYKKVTPLIQLPHEKKKVLESNEQLSQMRNSYAGAIEQLSQN